MVGLPRFTKDEVHPLALRESFLAYVRAQDGSMAYRHLYRRLPDSTLEDVIVDGDLACAYSVSAMLRTFNLIPEIRTWVSGTLADMLSAGWEICETPGPTRVVEWEEKLGDDGAKHYHIGICLDENDCISNYAPDKRLRLHPIEGFLQGNNGQRRVLNYYKHPELEVK